MGKHVIDHILKLVPLIIATVIAAGAAWMTQGWRYGTEIESIQRVHADTMGEISRVAAQQLETQMDRHKKQANEITLLDQRHYQELQDAQQNSVRLSADLAASHQRLSVRVQHCSSGHLPATASPPSLDDGTQRAELYPQDAAALATITADADRCAVKLSGLQGYVCAIKPDAPGCG
jgi:hypothetical protein